MTTMYREVIENRIQLTSIDKNSVR